VKIQLDNMVSQTGLDRGYSQSVIQFFLF